MDLFDMVRAAPPPKNVRDSEETENEAATESETKTDQVEDANADEDEDADAEAQSKADELLNPKVISSTPNPVTNYNSGDESETPSLLFPYEQKAKSRQKSEDIEEIVDDADALEVDADVMEVDAASDAFGDEEMDEDGLLQTQPPKTKAQQKMFSDLPASKRDKSQIKKCIVRIKRMSQTEVERLTTKAPNKRGRPRKNPEDSFVSPPKKQKMSKAVIKLPQNGSKQQKQWQDSIRLSRAATPPPTAMRSQLKSAGKSEKSNRFRLPMTSSIDKDLIGRYGKRFFRCVVKVKRLKDSHNFGRTKRKSKSKSKLSVSFSEAVEILGSNPRKSSSTTSIFKSRSSLCESVPTRLQRVDATGNVVEDIELNPSILLDPSPRASTSAKSKQSRSGTCNGGRRGRKPRSSSVRVPVSDLASLSIDDGADNEAGDEYIVPNELPEHQPRGVRRSGTPSPVKRVVTTTVSDSEDNPEDNPEEVKSSMATKTTDIKESETVSKATESPRKPEDIEEELEKLQWEPDLESSRQEETQDKLAKVTIIPVMKEAEKLDGEKQADEMLKADEQETNLELELAAMEEGAEVQGTNKEETMEKAAEATQQKKVESTQDKEESAQNTSDETIEETFEEVTEEAEQDTAPETELEAILGSELEVKLDTALETELETELEARLDLELESELKLGVSEDEQDDNSRLEAELDAQLDDIDPPAEDLKKASPVFPAITDVTSDDILEIQTSIEDVRELETPPSQLETPQATRAIRNSHLGSPESDSSFKSATADELAQATTLTDPKTSASTDEDLLNGSEPASTSSTVQPSFSTIEMMPNLDDDELGQLVAPDFQLSNSGHAISRGTLDDIMTVLES